MVKNLPSNTEDVGLILGQGTKIPHAMRQLSPQAATTEPRHSWAHAQQEKATHAATRESQSTKAKTCAAKSE